MKMDRYFLYDKLGKIDSKMVYTYINRYGYPISLIEADELLKFTRENFNLIYDTDDYISLIKRNYDERSAKKFIEILSFIKEKLVR